MVTVNYIGRFGNNLCQYIFGRLLAVRNNLKLATEWNRPDMIEFTPNPDGTVEGPVVKLDDQHAEGHPTDLTWLEQDFRNKHVVTRGYFQHPKFYDTNKTQILSWMKLPPVELGHEKEVVCHLRLDDYDITGGVPIIDKSWYVDMLKRELDKKVYIVVEEPKKAWERKYVDELIAILKNRDVTIRTKGTPHDDFHFIRSFGTIITSNSSYCWWAAWLAQPATKIYTFSRWRFKSPTVRLAYAHGMIPTQGSYIWEKEDFHV